MEWVVFQKLLSGIDRSDFGVSRSDREGLANVPYGTDGRVHPSDVKHRGDAFDTLVQRSKKVGLRAIEFQFGSRKDLGSNLILQPMNTNVIGQGRWYGIVRSSKQRSTERDEEQ